LRFIVNHNISFTFSLVFPLIIHKVV